MKKEIAKKDSKYWYRKNKLFDTGYTGVAWKDEDGKLQVLLPFELTKSLCI